MGDFTAREPPEAALPNEDAMPRLGICHLMLWGVGTAVVMSTLSTIRLLNQWPVNRQTYLHDLLGGIAYGAAFAGILIGLQRWREGRRLIYHPGHLYLYFAGAAMLLDLGLTLVLSMVAQMQDRAFGAYFFHRQLIGYSVSIVVLVAAAIRCRPTFLWCLPIAALLLLSIMQVAGSLIFLVDAWRPLLGAYSWLAPYKTFVPLAAFGTATLLLVALVDFFRTGQRRDWLHWAGVGVFLAMAAPHLIGTALRWL